VSLRLMQQLSIPQIDYNKLVVFSSTLPIVTYIKRVYPNTPYEITNLQQDNGILARSYAVELNTSLVYVNDYRHSHDCETEDTTQFQVTSTTETEILKIDYGTVLSVKALNIKVGCATSSAGSMAYVKVYISSDGSTWTQIATVSNNTTSEVISRVGAYNISFRYLRFTAYNNGYTTIARIRKIFIEV